MRRFFLTIRFISGRQVSVRLTSVQQIVVPVIYIVYNTYNAVTDYGLIVSERIEIRPIHTIT